MYILYNVVMMVVLKDSCAAPAKFFWKPNMQINFRADNKADQLTTYRVHYPSIKNIESGRVVLINGYNLGASMIAIATVGLQGRPKFPQFDLRSGDFYTNAYRWALRAISLIPEWLAGGSDANYPDSHSVWRKRFYYMEEEVPQWLRSILFFVDDWDRDEWAKKRYNLYARPAFDKHMRFPSPIATDNFASFNVTKETAENLDDSEVETVAPRLLAWGPKPYDDIGYYTRDPIPEY